MLVNSMRYSTMSCSHINGPVSGGGEAFEVDDEDARPPLHRVPLDAPRPRLAAAAGRLLVAVQGLLCKRESERLGRLIRLITALHAMDMPDSAYLQCKERAAQFGIAKIDRP